jgi:hypothetical protein
MMFQSRTIRRRWGNPFHTTGGPVVYHLAAVLIGGLMMIPPVAMAQKAGLPGFGFDGEAKTGGDARRVRFRFFCSSNDGPNATGVLSAQLEVTRFEQLRDVFNFDPLEGPDSKAGALSRLQATGARGKAADSFTASGSILAAGISAGSTEAFMLEVSATRRNATRLQKLAAVLRPLLDGPGQLVWQQRNAKSGGTPLVATLDLAPAQSDQLKAGLGPCLGSR